MEGARMACEEADSEAADEAGVAAGGVPLTRTTAGPPEGSAACEPVHGCPAGLIPDGELTDPTADLVAVDGMGAPQLPGMEIY
jgi:hypothetical protein